MLYHEYTLSRDLAWKIIIQEGWNELPVRVSKICRNMGIDIRLVEGNLSGYSAIVGGTPTIYINRNDTPERQRFTCAHELGHILHKHTEKYGTMYRDPEPNDDPMEQAANVFASRLLAPAIVLRDLGVTTEKQIMELFHISQTAAKHRMARLNEIYKRNEQFLATYGRLCFGLSKLERQVQAQFTPYINSHKL